MIVIVVLPGEIIIIIMAILTLMMTDFLASANRVVEILVRYNFVKEKSKSSAKTLSLVRKG